MELKNNPTEQDFQVRNQYDEKKQDSYARKEERNSWINHFALAAGLSAALVSGVGCINSIPGNKAPEYKFADAIGWAYNSVDGGVNQIEGVLDPEGNAHFFYLRDTPRPATIDARVEEAKAHLEEAKTLLGEVMEDTEALPEYKASVAIQEATSNKGFKTMSLGWLGLFGTHLVRRGAKKVTELQENHELTKTRDWLADQGYRLVEAKSYSEFGNKHTASAIQNEDTKAIVFENSWYDSEKIIAVEVPVSGHFFN